MDSNDAAAEELVVAAIPCVKYTLTINTSGPLGKHPRPPRGVLTNSLSGDRSNESLFCGDEMNEKIVSPGIAAVPLLTTILTPEDAPAKD